jgi:dTDP-4-dehydrorhamnose 3,5-epimerase
MADAQPRELPQGVLCRSLAVFKDGRGDLTEVYREEWSICGAPKQWNVVRSLPGTLRGVHVHNFHADYLFVADGHMVLGIHDIRADSPTRGWGMLVDLKGDAFKTIYLPPGVAHGFYFPVPTTYFYALSHHWTPDDELGCSWNAPELGLHWPAEAPVLSQRDQNAGSYRQMVDAFHERKAAAEHAAGR